MTSVESVSFSGAPVLDRWNALVQRNILDSPFSSGDFLTATRNVFRGDCTVHFVVEAGDDVAGIVVFETTTLIFSRIVPLPLTPFCALAATYFPTEAAIHARNNWIETLLDALEERYASTDLMLPPSISDVRSFQWRGWTASPLYTFVLGVKPAGELLKSWSESASRTFRKHGDNYVLSENAERIDNVFNLFEESYGRRRRHLPVEVENLKKLATELLRKGVLECWTVESPGASQPEAGILLLKNKNAATYWIAGSKPGPAMTVLIGHLMDRLSSSGCATFDFVGANTPTIAEFKRRFSPELIPYFRVRHASNRWIRFVMAVRNLLRRV